MTQVSRTKEDLTAKVIALVTKLCQPDREITPASSFLDELEVDSLTMLRLDVAIQGEIGLALSAEDIDRVATVSDLVDALLERGQPVEAYE